MNILFVTYLCQGKIWCQNLHYIAWHRMRIPSLVHCAWISQCSETVEDAQIVRFCQVETEADNLSIGVVEKRIWANAEIKK